MFLSKHFLPILVLANKSSSKISGQMFLYNPTNAVGFEVSTNKRTKIGYQIRYILCVLVAIEELYRILRMMTTQSSDSYMGSSHLETSFCVMFTICSILIAERYRVRGNFSKEYVTYYNSILLSESQYEKGQYLF